jgi:outer membrane protein OmpA-like peptidoglycan-associated protein
MNHKGMLYLSFVLLVGLISLWGCPKKTEVTTTQEAQTQSEKGTSSAPTREGATADAKHGVKPEGQNEKSGAMAEGLMPVYFDFDKSFIRDDAKNVMKANVQWLKANPKTKIRIEGN